MPISLQHISKVLQVSGETPANESKMLREKCRRDVKRNKHAPLNVMHDRYSSCDEGTHGFLW
ncbi:hypothetical protein M404DRAFT_991425 [Pisolithus tinctorius Marx 270]|uniref:Uncharacterized protein n=1 Tax=Pisolithus tinctorius Marx 270 TaxID=870435 RepID=A0A0C3JZT7_PISTI|nr:hypothetical protein M404DRAFT_991425 [Pisolithus tinctorius Marx 270]